VADWRCVEGCPVAMLAEQSGESISSGGTGAMNRGDTLAAMNVSPGDYWNYGDTGTAARFFQQFEGEWDCHPECPVAMLAEQSGERPSGVKKPDYKRHRPKGWSGPYADDDGGPAFRSFTGGDTGIAARFFKQFDGETRFQYCAKASKSERNAGCDDLYWRRDKDAPIGYVRISREEWEELPKRQRAQGNVHPTIKPLGVLRYLARLIIPPERNGEPRRAIVPFSGSGSEMLGLLLGGWEDVTGIELHQDYNDIAEARLRVPRQLKLQ